MNEVLNKFLDRLTSNFNVREGSNIHALLDVTANHIQENEDTLKQIEDWRDIDQAQGNTLNRIGGNVQQPRGQAEDSVYRVLIKSKIKRNLSNGSINTLVDFLSFILQINQSEVEIIELWDKGEHATLKVNVPGDAINSTGLTANQFGTLINLVIAAGVKANVLFEGTFSFSNDYTTSQKNDPDGFSNIKNVPDFNDWTLHANATIVDSDTLQLDATAADQVSFIDLASLAALDFAFNSQVGLYDVDCLDSSKALISQVLTDSSSGTFTTPTNTAFIRIKTQNGSSGSFTFEKPELFHGSTASETGGTLGYAYDPAVDYELPY